MGYTINVNDGLIGAITSVLDNLADMHERIQYLVREYDMIPVQAAVVLRRLGYAA